MRPKCLYFSNIQIDFAASQCMKIYWIRTLLWVMSVIACLSWIASIWCYCMLTVDAGPKTCQVEFRNGAMDITNVRIPSVPARPTAIAVKWGVISASDRGRIRWKLNRSPTSAAFGGGAIDILEVPLWPLVLLTFLFSAGREARYRRSRSRSPGNCRRCAYPLAGLPSSDRCPECGERIPADLELQGSSAGASERF